MNMFLSLEGLQYWIVKDQAKRNDILYDNEV